MKVFFTFIALMLLNPVSSSQGKEEIPKDGRDIIRLASGEVLKGTITRETKDFIHIRIKKGMVIGIEKSRTIEIIRLTRNYGIERKGEEQPRLLEPYSLGFFVFDWKGKAIGTRRAILKEERTKDGRWAWRLEEKWFFPKKDKGPLIIIRTEWFSPLLHPLKCFYREVSGDEDSMHIGRVAGNKLELEILSPRTRKKVSFPFTKGTMFPMMAKEIIKQREKNIRQVKTILVYDAMYDAFRRMRIRSGGIRGPVHGPWGDWGNVFVLLEERQGKTFEEWVDGSGRTLYLEANGLDLRAVRYEKDKVRKGEAGLLDRISFPRICKGRDPLLVLPDPGWKFLPGKRERIVSKDLNASMEAISLPGTKKDLVLQQAAKILEKNISMSEGPLANLEYSIGKVGASNAIFFTGTINKEGRKRIRACLMKGKSGLMGIILKGDWRRFDKAIRSMDKILPFAFLESQAYKAR